MEENIPIIELKNIRKEFPGVIALNNVSLSLYPGSVHALVGENGAGKSTLMKILSGSYANYEGEILLDGKQVHFQNEHDALSKGISIVPQELNPIPEMTISENVYLGREPKNSLGFVDLKKRDKMASECLEALELNYNPKTKMKDLSIAQQQMIEIVKAISRNSRIIIMDEPTSALTDVETEYLFNQIKQLKSKGISLVFISHKLDEVYKICDTYTVLRDGEMIRTGTLSEITQNELISLMVGRPIANIYPKINTPTDSVMLKVDHLTSSGVFQDVSFEIHKGEIVGLAGIMGAGRSEIARAIFGFDRYDSGSIQLEGKPLNIKSTHDAIQNGISMVCEDRAVHGFVGVRSIKDNIVLPNSDLFTKKGILQFKNIKDSSKKICEKLSVKAPSIDTLVGNLSGGNQQKVVLSKWLVRNVKLLILDEPTRGIDVGAKQEIYRLIVDLASQGLAILLIASELPEVISMSHRVEVVANGKIVGELTHEEATQDKIMSMIIKGRKN